MRSAEGVRMGSDPGENISPLGCTTHQFTTQAGTEAYRAQTRQSTASVPSQRTDKALAPGSDQADPAHELDSLAKTIRLMITDARDSTKGLDPENNVLARAGVKISQPEPYSGEADLEKFEGLYHSDAAMVIAEPPTRFRQGECTDASQIHRHMPSWRCPGVVHSTC